MFKIDPVVVLNAEPLEWMVRVASHNIIADDLKKERSSTKRR